MLCAFGGGGLPGTLVIVTTGLRLPPLVPKTDQTAPKKKMSSSVVASSSHPMMTLPLAAIPTPVLSVDVLFKLVFTSKVPVRGIKPLAWGVPGLSCAKQMGVTRATAMRLNICAFIVVSCLHRGGFAGHLIFVQRKSPREKVCRRKPGSLR